MDIIQKIDKKIEETKIGDETITIAEYKEIKSHIKEIDSGWSELMNDVRDTDYRLFEESRKRMKDLNERTLDSLGGHLNKKHLEEIESKNNMLTLSSIIIFILIFVIIGINA